MTSIRRLSSNVLRSPLLWGALATVTFYALLWVGQIDSPFVQRYFAGHWVNYTEVAAFFVGLSSLLLKAFDLARQATFLHTELLEPRSSSPLPVGDARRLLAQLDDAASPDDQRYLPRRLRDALTWLARGGSAANLDEELKHLADTDAGRAEASYALVRFVIWAIPILGFLGTVIGITNAIASLSPEQLEGSLNMVTAGLGVAFDTTAVALALSMVLMFVQYRLSHWERDLLESIDRRVVVELSGRFRQTSPQHDPHVEVIEQMAEHVVAATQRMVEHQAQQWQHTIAAVHDHWRDVTTSGQQQLEQTFVAALGESLAAHTDRLLEIERRAAAENAQQWELVQQSLTEASRAARQQLEEIARLSQSLTRLVEATGGVVRLEDALHRNLTALAGAHHFEETLLSLTAAIHLLSARQSAPTPGMFASHDHVSASKAA